ncbi:MAG: NTP transferase domain-containing protein [Chloroflexi bacterium]|jgi:mannose-1-phosphate guanylyltransferase|nr:NTP transferase domain-containing protein [Chloroflexota bacterium]
MLQHYYAVIMAGGGGTRLWPLSRKRRPKQMLSLFDERSLFQTTVARVRDLFPVDHIYVVTVAEQAVELQAQVPDIPKENYLIEPMPRGTASVVGMAAVVLAHRDPQAVMAVLTSDHYMANEPRFRQLLQAAYHVSQDGYLVTLGIEPTFPATGYGYIQQGERLGEYESMDVYRVKRFKEKPDEEHARLMLASGDHAWNSGMFVWRVRDIMEEFRRQMPKLAASLDEIAASLGTAEEKAVVERIWPGLENETIDYGIMEGARNAAVIPATDLGWSDVGSWDSLFDVIDSDPDGNIIMGGRHVGVETRDSLVYVNQDHRLIVTIGVENLVVVDTGDVLLVCQKDQAQKVRQVVNRLKEEGQDYL